ncbi:PREDICTED: protein SRC2-like [Camelina sativa]|uniref:Protein SRC2-like n=1 Tax=Camelina sativa TaxID=90675 RepID=A0ABM0V691_CAMSA|nr:PREDICTED: protein SRC2-like [Camelina sativa]
MTNLTLELNIKSASNLVNVNFITKMNVYVNITIHDKNSRKKQKAKTNVDRSRGSNPVWYHPFKFSVNESLVYDDRLTLVMRLVSRRSLGNIEIGRVSIPLLELLNSVKPPTYDAGNSQEMKLMIYQVRTPSGTRSGTLTFSYRFKPDLPAITNQRSVDKAAYPPPSQISHPPQLPIEFPKLSQTRDFLKHPFASRSSNDPLPISYCAVETEEAGKSKSHGLYAPPPASHQGYGRYGYASPSPVGYGYASSSYQQHPKETGLGIGIGLGAGLLGGLVMGDIVSDVANCFDD